MNKFNPLAFPHVGFVTKTEMFLASLLFALIFLPNDANALDVECEIPNSIVCEVSDPNGFMSVWVNVDFGDLGQIDVVSHTFPTCRTSATVSWDTIVPNFQIFTAKCKSGGGFKFDGRGHRDSAPVIHTRNFEIKTDESERFLSVKEIKPVVKPLLSVNILGNDNVQYIYKTDCEWTNDNVASCFVMDCDSDGVCVELGTYCVDHYGRDIPCP